MEHAMQWTAEAEQAVRKIPFFVRKKVRASIEAEAARSESARVTMAHVQAVRARYLDRMSEAVKGFRLDTCFGAGGCPNRARESDALAERIGHLLRQADILGLLKERVRGELKFHHEFRVSIADCPNACSQPQIQDIGIVGAALPRVTAEPCTGCNACVEACREGAVERAGDTEPPRIDPDLCLACGACMKACPSGTLAVGQSGYRVLLGGKLGRHPRLARALTGLFSEAEVLSIVRFCLAYYKKKSLCGERFAQLLTDADFEALEGRFKKPSR
jgi:anaerobic sulfite reductase subunit C